MMMNLQPLITGMTYNEGMAFSTFHANDTSPPDEPVPPLGNLLACGALREARYVLVPTAPHLLPEPYDSMKLTLTNLAKSASRARVEVLPISLLGKFHQHYTSVLARRHAQLSVSLLIIDENVPGIDVSDLLPYTQRISPSSSEHTTCSAVTRLNWSGRRVLPWKVSEVSCPCRSMSVTMELKTGLTHLFNCSCLALWVSLAANASADPRNHLGQAWPRYVEDGSRQIMVFGNATMPSASTVADVSLAEYYAGGC